jgi:hypothetical protein
MAPTSQRPAERAEVTRPERASAVVLAVTAIAQLANASLPLSAGGALQQSQRPFLPDPAAPPAGQKETMINLIGPAPASSPGTAPAKPLQTRGVSATSSLTASTLTSCDHV